MTPLFYYIVGTRFVPPYQDNEKSSENPKFEERSLGDDTPYRRSISNPERRGAFFRTFFPLIWQVSIPKAPAIEPSVRVPGSPKPEDMEMTKTSGVALPEEVTTPFKVEMTPDTTTQPPRSMIEVTGMQASTTPPARLEEEKEPGNIQTNLAEEEKEEEEVDNEERDEEQLNDVEEIEVDDMNENDEDPEMANENRIIEKSLEGESEEQGWKTSTERNDNLQEDEDKDIENNYNRVEESYEENDDENPEENPNEIHEEDGSDNENQEQINEDPNDFPTDNRAESDERSKEEGENIEEEKSKRQNRRKFRGPVLRFLFRSPRRFNRRMYRRPYSPFRPGPLEYRSYNGPRNMNSESKFGRPSFRRPSPFEMEKQRRIQFWRDRKRGPKNGISFTQVFVNKPPHPPIATGYPLLPAPVHPYPHIPFHPQPVPVHRYPGNGYSRTFSIQGMQQPGSAPRYSGYYKAVRWPANGPKSQVEINFRPRIGEPNLACTQPTGRFTGVCLEFPVPHHSGTMMPELENVPFSTLAGCGSTLNRFNSRMECETTCMGMYF